MESEDFLYELKQTLSQKEGIVYKKALTIIDTIAQLATKSLTKAQMDDVFSYALFVMGNAYTLLLGYATKDHEYIEALLVIVYYVLPRCNAATIASSPIKNRLTTILLQLLNNTAIGLTPLAYKYSLAALTQNLILSSEASDQSSWEAICFLVKISLEGWSALLKKEGAKSLSLVLERHSGNKKLMSRTAEYVKGVVFEALEARKKIWISSLAAIQRAYFPANINNDLCYAIKNHLVDDEALEDQDFQIQIYFYLDKVFEGRDISSTVSEQVLKVLINNIPTSIENQRLTFGYMQALYECFNHLSLLNNNASKKYLSSCVSILSEMLLRQSGQVVKQAETIMARVIQNSLDNNIWNTESSELMDLENLELDESGHVLTKVVAMLRNMIGSGYENVKSPVLRIYTAFFKKMRPQAFDHVKALIVDIVNTRETLPQKELHRALGAAVDAMGVNNLLQLYSIGIEGDPTDASFEESNNLWMLKVFETKTAPEPIGLFFRHFLPLIKATEVRLQNETRQLRRDIFFNVLARLWSMLGHFPLEDKRVSPEQFQFLFQQLQANLQPEHPHFSTLIVALRSFAEAGNPGFAPYAEKTISTLAKVLDLEHASSNVILETVERLSMQCSRAYLDRVFEKNVVKLLNLKSSNKLEPSSENLKNLELIRCVSRSVDFEDPRVLSNKLSKEECMTKLIEGLLEQKNILQKKAYKLLQGCIEYMNQGFMTDTMDLLDRHAGDTMLSSRSFRITVFAAYWEKLLFSSEDASIEDVLVFVKKYLPEIIVALRDSNQRVRKEALRMFTVIADKMESIGVLDHFVEMVCAGLAAKSWSTKADTVYALVQVLDKFKAGESEEFLGDLLDVVLILLKEQKKEIYKAVLTFARKFVLRLEKSQQLEILPKVFKSLFEDDEDSKMELRSVLRHFLLKLIKKHTQAVVTKLVPDEHQRFVKSTVKAENTLKKQLREKRAKLREEREQKRKAAAAEQDESSSQESSAEEEGGKMDEEEVPVLKQALDAVAAQKNLLLKYDLDKQDFHFVEDKRKREVEKKKQVDPNEDFVDIVEGKLVVRQAVKRRREDDEKDGQEEQQELHQNRAPRKIVKAKDDKIHEVKESGSTYRATRASGDIRHKNKPQPHAFIQLSQKALNKRYRHKAEKVFESVFQKKEGGLKGLRSRLVSKGH